MNMQFKQGKGGSVTNWLYLEKMYAYFYEIRKYDTFLLFDNKGRI